MVRPDMAWERDDYRPSWKNAETAGAILYLLQNEPFYGQKEDIHEFDEKLPTRHCACSVCFETFDSCRFPQKCITEQCDHGPTTKVQICIGCLKQSLKIQLSSRGPNSLSCPLCHESLSRDDVQRWASSETFRAFSAMRARARLQTDPKFVACTRAGCGFGQIHIDGRDNPQVVCASCGNMTCFNHRETTYHSDLTCEEYDKIMNLRIGCFSPILRVLFPSLRRETTEERRSKMLIKRLTKPCPFCNTPTQKKWGCNQLKCYLCGKDWCYGCGHYWHRKHACP